MEKKNNPCQFPGENLTVWLLWDRALNLCCCVSGSGEFALRAQMRKAVAHTGKIARPLGQNERARPQRLFAFCARHSIRDRPPLFLCRHAEARQKSAAAAAVRLIRRAFIIDLYYCEFLCSASLKILHFPPPPLIDTYIEREGTFL